MNYKKEILKSLILSFQQRIPVNSLQREIGLPLNTGKIISVCGVRRSGKTYLLYDTINRLIQTNKVEKQQILFINFDDERLHIKAEELDLILQAYRELFPQINIEEIFFFFDEIQMADGWEQFIRRIYDQISSNIYISGSNSRLLATDIASSLRGRTLQIEVFPLSFKEFCRFKQIDTNSNLPENKAKILNGFYQFLSKGGFPELVLHDYQYAEKILQEYYYVMLYKDIVERYSVKNIPVLKYLINRLLSNLCKPTSIHKIYNEIKSAGLKLDKNILYELAEQLENVFFSQRLTKYSQSVLKSELSNEKKIYFIDNGMVSALNYSSQNDFGKLFENLVYLWLRSKYPFQRGLYFYKGKRECDFVLVDKDQPTTLIQACWDISEDETLKREIAGLAEASQILKCNNAIILTPEREDEIVSGDLKINIQAAWREMLK
jgi:uncharacterized protein